MDIMAIFIIDVPVYFLHMNFVFRIRTSSFVLVFVDCLEKVIFEMTYDVSSGSLNLTSSSHLMLVLIASTYKMMARLS